MAIDNFIPTVWSGMILQALDTAHVYGAPGVINGDYEGEISAMGDSVRINSIGDVTVKSYTKNTDIDDPETLNDGSQTLLIDQGDYFNFQVDSVDKAQQNPKVMAEATRRAAYKMKDEMDTYIASLYTGISATNVIGSDGSPEVLSTETDTYDALVDLGVLLSESDVPTDGRFVVVPPWVEGRLLKDGRFVSFGTVGNVENLQNGRIGRAAGFDIYVSNNVPVVSSTKYKIIAGHPMGWTKAQQILDVRAYQPEKRFGDAVKGLQVYGAKIVRPECLALLTASKS